MQKGTKHRIKDTKKEYTVECFYGKSLVEYKTYQEAKDSNDEDSYILVKNKETDGALNVEACEFAPYE